MRDSAATQLRAAEHSLLAFVGMNRQYRGSPELSLAFDTLSRRITIAHSSYISLIQAAEQARLDEVRDTPVIAVIEEPERPRVPDRRVAKAVLGVSLLICGVLVPFAFLMIERRKPLAQGPPGGLLAHPTL
jgi:uncharacterized protein involved in exopolysaccharide biosynthesis